MGVEPYLVASSLEAVLAQRLVRVLCERCKQPDHSPAAQAFKAQVGIPADTTIYRSVGCRECRHTGFFGRHAIFEWMDSDNEIRAVDSEECLERRDPRRRPPRGHADAGRGRLAAGAPGHHHGRGSAERDHGQRGRAHHAEGVAGGRREGADALPSAALSRH